MSTSRPVLDLLALAEDVVEGRRSLENVIDQIAVNTSDDRERRRAVGELQSLVLALNSVRAHARATAAATTAAPAASRSGPQELVVAPRRVLRRRSAFGLGGPLAAGATAVVAVILVAVALGSLRPSPATGGPSPSGIPNASPTISAPTTPTAVPTTQPPATPTASPTPVLIGAYLLPKMPSQPLHGSHQVAFWTMTDATTLHIWKWDSAATTGLQDWLDLQVRTTAPAGCFKPTVLVSPDGTRVAVNERDTATAADSSNRVAVFDTAGKVLWTSPANAPAVVDMAWSPDSAELALGSIPVPWVVLTFSPDRSVDATTYNLPGDRAYRLLGFTSDDAHLIGYETSGEAEFWEKPAALDLSRGTIASINAFPTGMGSNSTQPLGQVSFWSGAALALVGSPKANPEWAVVQGASQQLLGIDRSTQLSWATDREIVEIAIVGTGSPWSFAVSTRLIDGPPEAVTSLPVGVYQAALQGVRDRQALLMLRPQISVPCDLGPSEAVLVDLVTGATGVTIDPAPNALGGLHFAGWIGPAE